jgi:hypothetical protein
MKKTTIIIEAGDGLAEALYRRGIRRAHPPLDKTLLDPCRLSEFPYQSPEPATSAAF